MRRRRGASQAAPPTGVPAHRMQPRTDVVAQAADQVPRKWMTSNRFGAAAAAAVVVLLLAAAFTTPVAGAVAPEQQHALLAHSAATMPDDSMFVAAQGTAHSPQQLPPAPTPVWQHSRVRIRPATAAGQPPLPELLNYDFNTSRDTFELCREMSGLGGRELSLEELLPALSLPADLTRRGRLDLASFVELLRLVQPDFRVIYKPMLAGEPELGGLLTTPGGLPRLVHFTVKDKDSLAPHQVVSMASWAYHNPGHSLMLFDDADVREFMESYYPQLLPTFDGLGSQVERTDMWRYLVLCRFGGVYADSDVVCARPVSQWATDAGLLVGVENVFTTPEEAKRRDYARQVQMVQWVIASRPGHPVVCRMGAYIARHVAAEAASEYVDPDRDHAILERTGPGIWSSSVHDYVDAAHGNGPGSGVEALVAGGVVGDVRVLPQPVFGCASATYNPSVDPLPYVYHMFKGSWRAGHSPSPSSGGMLARLREALRPRHGSSARHGSGSSAAAAGDSGSGSSAAGSSSSSSSSSTDAAAAAQQRRAAAAAAAAAASEEAAQFARAAPAAHNGVGVILTPRAAAAAVAAAPARVPRLPVLDEQILAHKQQLEAVYRAAAAAAVAAVDTASAAGAAAQQLGGGSGRGSLRVGHRSSSSGSAVAGAVSDSRRLRSSQLLLVRAAVSPAGGGAEPELPSSALGGLPALSIVVLVLLCCAVYKQQQASTMSPALLSSWAGRAAGAGRGLVGSMRSASAGAGLSRAGSRATLSGCGSAPLVSSGGRPPLPDRLQPLLSAQLDQQQLCYASGQQHGHPHRHKRSWGSATNFQQL